MTAGGEEVAALVHDPALLDEPALVESVRATAGLVLENERLAAEVRAQLAEVRASRGRIVAATDAERRRIERNLHDGAQQRLVTLSLALGLEASRADAAAAERSSRAQDEVEEAIAELRELARGIHPTLLRDEGLEAAVEALARRTPLPVTVRRHGAGASAGSGRARRLLRRLGSAHERRRSTPRRPRHRCYSSGNRRRFSVAVADDGRRRRPRHAPARAWPASATDSRRSTRRSTVDSEPGHGHDHPRRDPMRVVIADDAPLIREGLARLLTTSTASRSSTRSATPMRCSRASATWRPDVALRRHPHAADAHRRRAARGRRDPLALPRDGRRSSSRNTSSPSTRCDSSRSKPERVGYLMKERVGRVEQLLDAVRAGRSG